VLHPVGRLPAAVYWRRRLVVLLVLVVLLGGAAWGTVRLLNRSDGGTGAAAASGVTHTAVRTPALEQVLPSVAAVELPTIEPRTPAPETPRAPAKPVVTAGPTPGGPCSDDMIAVEVRAPASVASGSKPTFELVVRNTSAVPCTRIVDKELQELVLLDADGERVWGSNDCFPEESDERRTIGPGDGAGFEVVWGGLSSEPTCTAERTAPPPGAYVLRGRLDAEVSADTPLLIT
jgi:hypothetical protein